MENDEALRALVNTIIRDCCESETSDPERDDTIMIRETTLREIVERAILTTRQEVAPVADDAALREFTEYFVKNYPGPHTVIMDPNWHAPKIFRAAVRAMRSAGQTSDARDGE